MQPQKGQNDLGYSQDKPFSITVIYIYAPATDAETEIDAFYEDLQPFLEFDVKRRCPFHHGDWNAKAGN